jgi:hypothetical protein
VENPLFADVLGVTLQRSAFGRDALPTDFGFWHQVASGKSTLATAMAAMPSSRPMKPISSLVVALMPTFWDDAQRFGDVEFHRGGVGHHFGLLRYDGGIHVDDRCRCGI